MQMLSRTACFLASRTHCDLLLFKPGFGRLWSGEDSNFPHPPAEGTLPLHLLFNSQHRGGRSQESKTNNY